MMDMKDSDEAESESTLIGTFCENFFTFRVNLNFSDGEFTFPTDSRYISDLIKVTVIPEKKGTFLKHTEYEVK